MRPVLLLRREAVGPNAIWQADHSQLDLWVRDERDRPVKPWLTIILDDYSRAVAGFRVSLAGPAALQTALTLRDAIRPKPDPHWHVCGIPATFYIDHGADFTPRHLAQVAADSKMILAFSLVGQPRGRGRIERFFRTVHQLCLGTLPGYAPPGIPPPTTILSLDELEERLHHFVVAEYHQRLHGETGMAPQTRWEVGFPAPAPGVGKAPRSLAPPRGQSATRPPGRHPLPRIALPRPHPDRLHR